MTHHYPIFDTQDWEPYTSKHDGGWWIIYHLSAPPGLSINDFIDSDSCSLSYCSVDDAYTIIKELGTGPLLSEID